MRRVVTSRPAARCRWRRAVLVALLLLGYVPGWPPASDQAEPEPVPVAAAETGYWWPLSGQPTVTRRFDPPPQPWLSGHRGVDLAGHPDEQVRSAGAGVVFFAGEVAGVGVVSVDHPDGLRTTYQPVEPLVEVGTLLATGDLIGTLIPGHRGCPVAACLHWGLRWGNVYVDPLALLGLGQVRLLPTSETLRHDL